MVEHEPRAGGIIGRGMDFKVAVAGFGDAVADARVLDGAGDARTGMAAEGVAHGQQGFAQSRPFPEDLPGGDHAARGHGVVIAELPAVEAALFAQLVDEAFHREIGLVHPEAPERACGLVVGEDRLDVDVHRGDVVGADRVRAGAGHHRAARRGVGPGVGKDARLRRHEQPLFVAADDVMELHGMALGVHPYGLGTRQAYLDRTPQQIGPQRRVGLTGEIFLAAEGSAGIGQRHRHLGGGQAQEGGDVGLIVPDALRLHVEANASVLGKGEAGFGFEKGVLHGLRRVDGFGGEGAAGQRLVHGLAAPDALVEEDVAPLVDTDGRVLGLLHIEKRGEDFVVGPDARGGSAGLFLAFRNHAGQRVPDVTGDFPGLDVDGPVLGVEAEHALAGDVLGPQDADDAGHGRRFFRMDGEDAGARVFAEDQGPMRHAGRFHVVDEGARPDGALVAAVLGQPEPRPGRASVSGAFPSRSRAAASRMASTILT